MIAPELREARRDTARDETPLALLLRRQTLPELGPLPGTDLATAFPNWTRRELSNAAVQTVYERPFELHPCNDLGRTPRQRRKARTGQQTWLGRGCKTGAAQGRSKPAGATRESPNPGPEGPAVGPPGEPH